MNTWSKRFRRLYRQGIEPCRLSWYDCLCDLHEGVTDRLMSRSVSKRAADREIEDQLR